VGILQRKKSPGLAPEFFEGSGASSRSSKGMFPIALELEQSMRKYKGSKGFSNGCDKRFWGLD
jgi:hypothetical protein